VDLERGPLNLVSITEELLEWKCSGSGPRKRENGRRDPLRWPSDTLYPQELALTSPTNGGRSVGIARLRTKATEFCLVLSTQQYFEQMRLFSKVTHFGTSVPSSCLTFSCNYSIV
jgi:hypothetical protein